MRRFTSVYALALVRSEIRARVGGPARGGASSGADAEVSGGTSLPEAGDVFLFSDSDTSGLNIVRKESMANSKRNQRTDKGLEIPIPTKGDFDAAMRKVA